MIKLVVNIEKCQIYKQDDKDPKKLPFKKMGHQRIIARESDMHVHQYLK